jgi:hypothetical protein
MYYIFSCIRYVGSVEKLMCRAVEQYNQCIYFARVGHNSN